MSKAQAVSPGMNVFLAVSSPVMEEVREVWASRHVANVEIYTPAWRDRYALIFSINRGTNVRQSSTTP